MNELPSIPKFSLHRSRRFWGGLGLIVTLWIWFGISVCTLVGFYYHRVHISGGAADRTLYVAQKEGGFELEFWRQDGDTTPVSQKTSEWGWASSWILLFDPFPQFEIAGTSRFFIPLWPLPVFWTFYWPFWIWRGYPYRQKKKNSEQGEAQQPPLAALSATSPVI